jgi:hypothetical protein
MSEKKTIILTLSIVFALCILAVAIPRLKNRVKENPDDLIGNTAGNLNNGGYFCESDGVVYFANAYDEGTLYRMNSDESEIQKISKSEVAYLNVGGDYLYYYQKNSSAASSLGFVVHMSGLYRCKTNGQNVVCLDKSDCKSVVLAGNTLYYDKPVDGKTSLCLFRVDTNKANLQQVTDYLLNPVCTSGGLLYYNGTVENHYLYTMDTATMTESLLASCNAWYPVLYGNYIYYLDTDNDYRLCRYSLSDQSLTVLADARVDFFNLSQNYIYYQTNDENAPALMRMLLDGSSPEVVAEGIYSDINITSDYVYFHSYGADIPVYHTPADGAVSVSDFDAAKEAALANTK